VKFVLFALGDRAYGDLFCAAGRKLAARLVQLGAMPLCPIGYGDDNTPDGGVLADLDFWIETSFIPALLAFKKPPNDDSFVIDDSPKIEPPSYKVTVIQIKQEDTEKNIRSRRCASAELSSFMSTFLVTHSPLAAYDYTSGSRNPNSQLVRSNPMEGRVVSNRRITAEDWRQDVRHIRIEVDTGSRSKEGALHSAFLSATKPYNAGDVAVIMPRNSSESVNTFLGVLPMHIQSLADHELLIERLTPDATPWPSQCSLRSLLTNCADINSLPEREFLRSLSVFVDIEGHPTGLDQAKKLVDLSDSSGSALYADYIIREKRNFADVFFDFDALRTCNSSYSLTLEHLLGLLPPILPRQFSIASSPSTKEDVLPIFSPRPESSFSLEICVAVVEGKTPLGRKYSGLCSNFLANLTCNSLNTTNSSLWQSFPFIHLWIRPGSFGRLPLTINREFLTFDRPIICVGAGTGIAPLRALMRERFALFKDARSEKQESDGISSISSNLLIFGCRKKLADFHYSLEWQEAVDSGLMRLLTAFSQDQERKIYVQQVVRDAEDGTLLARHLLEHGGALYVAGGVKMARAVREEILEILGNTLAGGQTEAKMILKTLQKSGLFSVEAWS